MIGQAPAALATGELPSAAGLTVHAAVASLAADGEHQKAADLWRGHLDQNDWHASIYFWDSKVTFNGVERAVNDLVEAFADAGDR